MNEHSRTQGRPVVSDIAEIQSRLEAQNYICNSAIATALFLAQRLDKPLLIEGPPGVGKTELAKAAAAMTGKELIRLQCYEGLDETKALYEWKYGKQLLYTQVLKEKLGDLLEGAKGLKESIGRLHEFDDTFFSEEFLEPRPLLKALWAQDGAVLLIDEIDKADDEFEAFLLELLSDYQISVPELGTIKARSTPLVFLTSNNKRELGDIAGAMKSRSTYRCPSAASQAIPRLPPRRIKSRLNEVRLSMHLKAWTTTAQCLMPCCPPTPRSNPNIAPISSAASTC